MERITIPAGTVVKIDGAPFRFATETVVDGLAANLPQDSEPAYPPSDVKVVPTLNQKSAMTASKEEEMREAFEAWLEPDADNRASIVKWRDKNGGYLPSATYLNGCWEGWQAASAGRQELLEALREIAQMMSYSPDHGLEALAECKCIARAAIAKATGEQQ